jgi:hypothetical protein
VAFSVEPSQSPSGSFVPSLVIPSATTFVRPLQLDPVQHQHGKHEPVEAAADQLAERLAGALLEAARERRARDRAGLELDLRTDRFLRARVAPAGDAGEHPLEHDPVEGITIGEVAIGRELHLAGAVLRADTRTLGRDDAPAENDLARLVAVAVGRACRVGLAARADDVDDLLFHQLAQDAQADADREREQPLLRGPDQLAERDLHPPRQLLPLRLVGADDLDSL